MQPSLRAIRPICTWVGAWSLSMGPRRMGCPESALNGKKHGPAMRIRMQGCDVDQLLIIQKCGRRWCPLEARGQDGVTRASSGRCACMQRALLGDGAARVWPLPWADSFLHSCSSSCPFLWSLWKDRALAQS